MANLEQMIRKLGLFCGFKSDGERGYDPIEEIEKAIEKETQGAKPLAHNLLYESFDEEEEIFFNKDSKGFWFEIEPMVGSDPSLEKNLTLFFNEELPLNAYVQFLVVASHDVSDILNLWLSGRKVKDPNLERLTYYRQKFIQNCSLRFSEAAYEGRLARNFRTYITVSMPNKVSQEKLVDFKHKFERKLNTLGFGAQSCGVEDLIRLGKEILQPQYFSENNKNYDPNNNLSEQILDESFNNRVEEEQIVHEESGMISRILSLKELPERFSLAEMVELLGDEDKMIPARFIISYSLSNNLGDSGAASIMNHGHRVISAAGKDYSAYDTLTRQEAGEWIEVKDIHKRGEIFLQESMQVMITSPREYIEGAEETLRSIYNAQDWKFKNSKKVQRVTALAMMPMMQASFWRILRFFQLARNALSGEVVAKLPLQGEWKGVPSAGVLLIGRRGQLFNWDPYKRVGGGGNYNVTVMAPSGAGKSFLLEELVQSMLAKDTAVFVMDIGASYKNICNLLGGEMVKFSKENNISLNPFSSLSGSGARYVKANELLNQGKDLEEISEITGLSKEKLEALNRGGTQDPERDSIEVITIPSKREGDNQNRFVTKDGIQYAKSMIAAMCNVAGDPSGEGIIEKAIFEGIAVYGEELDITKLENILRNFKDSNGNPREDAAKLADPLFPFTEEGIHGRFFASSENEASFQEMLTVFELEELVNDKPLLSVVLQVVLMQITMQFLCGDRTRKFMLIVDEAWMILDYAASFLERFARTVRKYGGSLVVCAQDLSSFDNTHGDKKSQAAVLESSTWKLIMQQSRDGMNSFYNSSAYADMAGLIETVKKSPENNYSEVLINTDGVNIVGRLAVDPYSAALFSTEDEDFAYLLDQERKGVAKHDAVMKLAQKYGNLPGEAEVQDQ